MRRFIFFPLILIIVSCFYTGCVRIPSENIREIHLSVEYENFIREEVIQVRVGEHIVFKRDDNLDYVIMIQNGKEFLNIEPNHLVRLEDGTTSVPYYTIVNIGKEEYEIVVYCISQNV